MGETLPKSMQPAPPDPPAGAVPAQPAPQPTPAPARPAAAASRLAPAANFAFPPITGFVLPARPPVFSVEPPSLDLPSNPGSAHTFTSETVFRMLADRKRRQILTWMLDGSAWTAAQAATKLREKRSATSKHFSELAKYDIIVLQPDPRDARSSPYVLSPWLRPRDAARAVVDFGCCIWRVGR